LQPLVNGVGEIKWQVHIALGFIEKYYIKFPDYLKNVQKEIIIGFGIDYVFAENTNTKVMYGMVVFTISEPGKNILNIPIR